MRFLTAGESHGPALVGIIEGLPAGLAVSCDAIDRDLARRQVGYGAGARMQIERDRVELLGGVIDGRTIGAPVALRIENVDYKNWREKPTPVQTIPRPGHADLAGALKYGFDNIRLVAERASARETAMRVAVGAVARQLLAEFDIRVGSYVTEIGGEVAAQTALPYAERFARAEASDVRVYDEPSAERIRQRIAAVMHARDTAGGVIEIVALNVPPGLGSHVHWDRKLDGRLAQALMSIHAIKGVELGDGFAEAARFGTQAHDQFYLEDGQLVRGTNRAGGTEGGVANGQPIVVRAAMKPISTTISPQRSVDLATGSAGPTQYQRSDVCAVPAAAVVGEAMVAFVMADAFLEKFGGDSVRDIRANLRAYLEASEYWLRVARQEG